MTTQKDKRLQQAEDDFKKLEDLFYQREKARETKAARNLMNCMKAYLCDSYNGAIQLYNLYKLKKNRYPDENIRPKVLQRMKELIPLYKHYSERSLFNQ
jgi:hypothetical protein